MVGLRDLIKRTPGCHEYPQSFADLSTVGFARSLCNPLVMVYVSSPAHGRNNACVSTTFFLSTMALGNYWYEYIRACSYLSIYRYNPRPIDTCFNRA